MIAVDAKASKKCAFCKYWYDPKNEAIAPRRPRINLWEVDDKSIKKCLLHGYEMRSVQHCAQYECKLEVF